MYISIAKLFLIYFMRLNSNEGCFCNYLQFILKKDLTRIYIFPLLCFNKSEQ